MADADKEDTKAQADESDKKTVEVEETKSQATDLGTKTEEPNEGGQKGSQEDTPEQTQPADINTTEGQITETTVVKPDVEVSLDSDNVKEETKSDTVTTTTGSDETSKTDKKNNELETVEVAKEPNDNVKTVDASEITLTENEKKEDGATASATKPKAEDKGSKEQEKKAEGKKKRSGSVGVRLVIPAIQPPEESIKPLNLVLFGATGLTGRLILQQALEQGHKVTAIVRSPENMTDVKHENLEVKKGDACNAKTFSEFLAGKDAVLSALGTKPNRFANITLYSQSIREIHESMKSNGVSRLVAMSSWGTQDSTDIPFLFRWVIAPVLFKNYLADINRMEEYLRTTELNYTIVRPPELLKVPRPGFEIVVVEEGQCVPNTPFKIPRSDVATFMLNCLQINNYDKTMLAVGMRRK